MHSLGSHGRAGGARRRLERKGCLGEGRGSDHLQKKPRFRTTPANRNCRTTSDLDRTDGLEPTVSILPNPPQPHSLAYSPVPTSGTDKRRDFASVQSRGLLQMRNPLASPRETPPRHQKRMPQLWTQRPTPQRDRMKNLHACMPSLSHAAKRTPEAPHGATRKHPSTRGRLDESSPLLRRTETSPDQNIHIPKLRRQNPSITHRGDGEGRGRSQGRHENDGAHRS
jgi:hypothetical protein